MPLKNQRVLSVHKTHRKNEKRLNSIKSQRGIKESNYQREISAFGEKKKNVSGRLKNESTGKNETITLGAVFIIILLIVCFALNRINLHMAIQTIKKEGINYDYFREMLIPTENKEMEEYIKTAEYKKTDDTGDLYDYLALNTLLMQNGYSGIQKISTGNKEALLRNLSSNPSFLELKEYFYAILEDIKEFPVDLNLLDQNQVNYIDSWNYLRSYGGKRKHEGTDIMSSDNIPGVIKVLSMTDGTVEKMGWLEMGGYRIGIRGDKGAYFYYAHLFSYATELKIGDRVKAGDFLGLMGDSGYGKEGTTGMFPAHLHVGIYVNTSFGELSVNPYLILKLLEKR